MLVLVLGSTGAAGAVPINIGGQIVQRLTGASFANWATVGSANARFAGNSIKSGPPNGGACLESIKPRCHSEAAIWVGSVCLATPSMV